MECEKCTDDLTAYVDGELSDSRAQQVRSHLETCQACNAELSALNQSVGLVETYARPAELRPKVWQNVRARISAMEAPAPGAGFLGFLEMHRWLAVTTTLIATAALVLGLWSYLRYEQSQEELRQYMNAYIQQREAQDAAHKMPILNLSSEREVSTPDATDPAIYYNRQYDGNPFVQIDSTPYANPFRTEEQR